MAKFSTTLKKYLILSLVVYTGQQGFANIYTVTNSAGNAWWPANGDPGSLVRALDDANLNPGLDTIRFDLPGGTTITASKNPVIIADNGGLLIDGLSTQDGNSLVVNASLQVTGSNVIVNGLDLNVLAFGSITSVLEITGATNTFRNADVQSTNMGISITAAGTGNTIDNVTFQTTNHSAILTGGTNTITNCSFATTGANQNSVWINGTSTGNSVLNSTFTASLVHAISIENGGTHLIDSCTITGISDNAIMIRGTGNNRISNTSISTGGISGIGVVASNNTVNNCHVFNNTGAGILVEEGNSNTISNCNIYDNNYEGVGIQGTSTLNTVSNCNVYGNNKSFQMLTGNPVPEQGGIKSNGTSTTIENNFVYGNAANGILVYDVGIVGGSTSTGQGANSTVQNNVIGRNSIGTELGNGWNGIFVWGANGVTSSGNVVLNNGKGASHASYSMSDRISGIRITEVTSGSIINNFIGTDANKTSAGNDFDGITLQTNTSNLSITNNTIGYNGLASSYGVGGGIGIRGGSSNNTLQSNWIGMHQDLSDAGNNDYGISIEACSGNTIGGTTTNLGNNIGYSKNTGNQGVGIWLVLSGATNNQVLNNNISFNTGDGVLIERGAIGNTIGTLTAGNTINGNVSGINVKENTGGTTNLNSLRGNSFSCNTVEGITLSDNGNNLFGGIGSSKIVTTNFSETRPTFVSGTSPANAAVDIYARDLVCAAACDDTLAQGATYVTTVSANGTGAWEFDISSTPALTQANVIVMTTDTAAGAGSQNSSEFSACAISCSAPQNVTINGSGICAGGSATLVANSLGIDPTRTYQYYWYLSSVAPANEILPRNAANDSDIVVNSSGTYIVVVSETKDSAACSNKSPAFTFTVNSLPAVTVNDAEICSGSPAATFTAISDSIAVSYLWSANGSGTTRTATGTASGNYTVQVTDYNGCVGSGTGVLAVSILPIVALGPDIEICSGDSITLDAGNVGANYLWNTTETSQIIRVITSLDVSIEVTDANGCVGRDTVITNVNSLPVVTHDLLDYQICIDEHSIRLLGATPSGGFYTGVGMISDTVFDPSLTTPGTHTITYTYEDVNGCAGSAKDNMVVNPLPVVTVDDATMCAGDGATTFTATANSTAASYLWSANGTGILSTTSGMTAGNYTVQVTDNNGCIGLGTGVLAVNNAPTHLAASASSLTFTPGSFVQLFSNVIGETYLWYPTGETTQNIITSVSGKHTVTITYSSTGCSDTSSVTISEIATSVSDVSSFQSVLYPNPAKDETTLRWNSHNEGQISVINSLGQVVYKSTFRGVSLLINTSTFSRGLYQLSVKNSDDSIDTFILVIEK
jgi:parallel beta-helix repeat protein